MKTELKINAVESGILNLELKIDVVNLEIRLKRQTLNSQKQNPIAGVFKMHYKSSI